MDELALAGREAVSRRSVITRDPSSPGKQVDESMVKMVQLVWFGTESMFKRQKFKVAGLMGPRHLMVRRTVKL